MGCCSSSSKAPSGQRENDLLKQFLEQCHGVDKGWEKYGKKNNDTSLAIVSRKKDDEVPGLYCYRGVGLVSGQINDVFHYFEDQLGADRFELLEELDDRLAIYHWLHEWTFQRVGGSASVKGSKSRAGSSMSKLPIINDDHRESIEVSIELPNDGTPAGTKLSMTDSSEKLIAITDGSAAGNDNRKSSRKSSRKKKKSVDMSSKPANFVRNRDFVFNRSVFKLGPGRLCVIAESAEHKLKKKVDEDTVRGRIYMMGVLVEEIDDAEKSKIFNIVALEANAVNDHDALILAKRKMKDPLSRVTFLISLNPRLATEEALRLPDEEISKLLGESMVRSFVDEARAYFELEENKLFVKFRALASADIGEMGWVAQEKSKSDLQLGTNVKHPAYGHGIVRKFDMKGHIHVAYDNGDIIEHEASEKDNLHVAVQIGTRVMHPTRGAGTVKQFDETGRIHVKFDNNEYHRYKQPAWKKKMHEYKLLGTGGALETITISYRDYEESREKQGRVKFAVGVTTREVLEYILDYVEEEKTGNIIKNEIIETINMFHRIRYQHRKMPSPLTDRDFVYDEIWREVAPLTYVVITKSVVHPSKKDVPGVVRGNIFLSGYLIEPLFTEDGEDHIAQITHMLCIDPNGFIPPDAVSGIRSGQLLGAVTDMRAHFFRRTQQKKSISIVNRKRQSKRVSSHGSSYKSKLPGAT